MKILILHRVPFPFVRYDRILDHQLHDVVYVGTAASLADIPAELRAARIERPGVGRPSDEVLAAIGADPGFDRVISVSQYELGDAARVREALGVRGPTPADVRRADDKVEMKRAVARAGLRHPRFMTCAEALDHTGDPPWEGRTILKPVDGTGSENVSVHRSWAEARDRIRDAGDLPGFTLGGYELEEYVEGPILHFDGLMLAGEPVAALMSRYVGTCLDYANGAALGSVQIPERADLHDEALAFVRAVGIRNGPFHLELFETTAGLVFLEIAARPGGGGIGKILELATGVNLVDASLRIALDDTPLERHPQRDQLAPRPSGQTYGVFWFPGHLRSSATCAIEGAAPFRTHPRIVRWKENPSVEPPKIVSYFDFEIPVTGFVSGETSAEVESLVRRILTEVRVVAA